MPTPGALEVLGRPIDLADVRIPVYLQASRQDHIAPAASVYKAMNLFSGPRRFVLAGSGHIAGVINPPDRPKYQHWINPGRRRPRSLERVAARRGGAPRDPGGPTGTAGCRGVPGAGCPRAVPGEGGLAPIEPAPGSYVRVRCDA